MRGGRLRDRADRPVGGHPFPGGVCQHGAQLNEASLLFDRGRLNHGISCWLRHFRINVETRRQRERNESSSRPPAGTGPGIIAVGEFARFVSSAWALAKRTCDRAYGVAGALHGCLPPVSRKSRLDGTGFGALGPDAVAACLLGVLRHQAFELGLGLFVLKIGLSAVAEHTGELGPRIRDALMSTIRTASIRGRGSSMPNGPSRSPVSTQRQNSFPRSGAGVPIKQVSRKDHFHPFPGR